MSVYTCVLSTMLAVWQLRFSHAMRFVNQRWQCLSTVCLEEKCLAVSWQPSGLEMIDCQVHDFGGFTCIIVLPRNLR